ncbi:MAG: glycosyltransferase [Bacteroidota bacterium]
MSTRTDILTSPARKTTQTTELPPIVCFGIPRWEGSSYLSSTVQLMKELARTQRVLYVDYPYTYKDLFAAQRGQDAGIPLAELKGQAPRLQSRQLADGSTVQLLRLPPFAPANFVSHNWLHDQILAWNARRTIKAVRAALAELGWRQPIVVNAFNPALGNQLAEQLDESLLVYYCYDEISAAPWMAKHGARHETAFLQRADLTLVSSAGLYRNKKAAARACALVKNGVDLGVFQTTGERPTDLPSTPIIGYIGSVDDRLDYDVLQTVAETHPDASLVFLGRIMDEAAAQRMRRFPNVYVLGPRPIDQLGNYLAAFDVGLIPFVKNDLTAGIYPLKINEYLALGLPVVSTDFADLSDFRAVAAVANDTTSFLSATAQALAGAGLGTKDERIAFAEQNSWAGRAEQIVDLLVAGSRTVSAS